MKLPVQPPIAPMLAEVSRDLPRGEGWLYEPKWDGFRALVFWDGRELLIQSRDLKPLGRYFPELESGLRAVLPAPCVLDGEVVIATDRGLDFEALGQRIHPAASRIEMLARETPAEFVAFDVLATSDEDLMNVAQSERRARLERLLTAPSKPLHLTPSTTERATAADWFDAVLLMTFAYGGFEAALFVSGETRNSRKDAPVALLVALITATILYMSVQYLVVKTLPNAASTTTPAADAAGRFVGPAGASLIAAGVLISIYGYLGANMLHTPRLTFAMSEQGDIPAVFATIHPRFRTPSVSIVTFTVMLVIFATIGSYRWNVTLSAVSRLFIYGSIVAALPILRRKSSTVDAFRLPHATLIVMLALAFTGALVTRIDIRGFGVVAGTLALAGLNWLWARTRPQSLTPAASAN